MKIKIFTIAILLLPALIFAQEKDSITMGADYANDVYYSFENGEVKSEPRPNWNIAFQTDPFSSSILINDGNGAILKTYPNGDTADWETLDTAGYSQWPAMYNHEESWTVSAFERNALGHPDYGWGKYNMNTHDITGDSLFVLQLGDGTFKKVWIEKKVSAQNTYYFRYADLNGENVQQVELDISPYTGKNFVYYSLSNNEVVDREPAKDDWDIVFSRYMAMIGGATPYNVTGVLSNMNTGIAEYNNVSPNTEQWDMQDLDSSRSVIGYDWKEFDMGSFTYSVDDSTVFFATAQSGAIYKIHFTKFEGSSTGKVVFEIEEASTASVDAMGDEGPTVSVYPNPATQYVNARGDFSDQAVARLFDLSGKVVEQRKVVDNKVQFVVSNLTEGVYMLSITDGGNTISKSVLVR